MFNPLNYLIMKQENRVSLKDFVSLCGLILQFYLKLRYDERYFVSMISDIFKFSEVRCVRDDLFSFYFTRLVRFRKYHLHDVGGFSFISRVALFCSDSYKRYSYLNLITLDEVNRDYEDAL